MPDDLRDALATATNDRFARGHRLQINAPQAFIATGQRKHRASSHGSGNLLARLASEKTHTCVDGKLLSQVLQARAFWSEADEFPAQGRELRSQRRSPP